MQHWVPFDEARLYAALGVDNRELEVWMRDDHHTIGQLARQRTKMTTKEFAEHLIAP